MRRATILTIVATLVPVAVVFGGPASPVSAATVPPGFTDRFVAAFSRPTAVESLPDGRIVVLEQAGRVRAGFPGQALPTVLTLANNCLGGERGLLGFTHDPGFLSNRRVYVYYTRDAPGAPNGCVNRVSRFTMDGAIDPASETVLVDNISSLGGNHNGGDLDIGSDGNLYVSIGDAGTDPRQDGGINAARDLSLLNGKILRITLGGQPAPGNPLSGAGTEACATRGNLPSTPTTSCQELFAWGLRNPYRIAFDPNGGGDRFFINDVGASTREEVDEGGIGRDYGWNLCEGFCPGGPPAGITDPLTDYPRTVGTVITGGAFVPDGLWPADLDGGYFFSDAGSGSIFLRRANGTIDYATPWATDAAGIADMVFAFDEAGRMALYYTNNGDGELRKIVWNGQVASPTPSNLAFSAIPPTRAYDTRTGLGVTAGDVRSDTTRLIDLPAPASAQAALVNITVTNNAGWGFLEAWAPRSLRPPTSVVNVVQPGEDVANASVVTLDAQGRFVLHTAMATDVVVDVLGWFSTTPGTATAGRFVAVDPGRLIDTRHPAGAPLASGSNNPYVETAGRVDVPIAGQLGVPAASNVGAAVVVLTALGTTAPQSGFATAHPGGSAVPNASNVNTNGNGDIRANLAVVPVAADGSLSVTLERVDDVLVDVVGYFTSASAPPSASGLFTAVAPTRLYDERAPGAPPAPAGASLTIDLDTGLPAASGAIAVLQNLTITATTGFDFVTAYPGGGGVPEVSNVNAVGVDQTRAALAVTKLGPGATVGYFTFGTSMLVVDAFGYFRS
jgi:glucose/arabinose dehydrogenase